MSLKISVGISFIKKEMKFEYGKYKYLNAKLTIVESVNSHTNRIWQLTNFFYFFSFVIFNWDDQHGEWKAKKGNFIVKLFKNIFSIHILIKQDIFVFFGYEKVIFLFFVIFLFMKYFKNFSTIKKKTGFNAYLLNLLTWIYLTLKY